MADNDNGESTEEPTGSGSGKAGQGNVLRLVASRSDKHAENLQTLMTEVFGLATETLKWVEMEDYDSPVRNDLVKQETTLVGCYTKLLTTSHRHKESTREKP